MSGSDNDNSPPRKNGKDPADGSEHSKMQKTSSSHSKTATEDLHCLDLSSEVHSFHPLYLHGTDNPGQTVLSVTLTGSGNYNKWSRAMQVFFLGKNKLGFITGSCKSDTFEPRFHHHWERCNAVVFGWILNSVSTDISDGIMYMDSAYKAWSNLQDRFNKIDGSRIYQLHMEIVTCRQGTDSITAFYTKLTNLWTEFDSMCALPYIPDKAFEVHVSHNDNLRLFQFLMGLNDIFSNVRSNLLLWRPFPTLHQAYRMLTQEESQRNISSSIPNLVAPISANVSLMSEKSKKTIPNLECDFCHKKGHTSDRCYAKGCDFCKKKGHCRDNCFKLKPKPAASKSSNPTISDGDTTDVAPIKSLHSSVGSCVQGGIILTNEQFDKYLQKIGPSSGSSAATAISSADASVSSAGPLKWEGLGEWS